MASTRKRPKDEAAATTAGDATATGTPPDEVDAPVDAALAVEPPAVDDSGRRHLHQVSDGGAATIALPEGATEGMVVGGVLVTDRTTGRAIDAREHSVSGGAVTRTGGTWAAGRGRWLVECDVQD